MTLFFKFEHLSTQRSKGEYFRLGSKVSMTKSLSRPIPQYPWLPLLWQSKRERGITFALFQFLRQRVWSALLWAKRLYKQQHILSFSSTSLYLYMYLFLYLHLYLYLFLSLYFCLNEPTSQCLLILWPQHLSQLSSFSCGSYLRSSPFCFDAALVNL